MTENDRAQRCLPSFFLIQLFKTFQRKCIVTYSTAFFPQEYRRSCFRTNILKFADHTKLFCKVGSDINCAKLRADLRKLYNGLENCQMLFNLDKCKIMHFRYNSPNNSFLLGGYILETVDEEKDLGVMIWKYLKVNVLK